MHLPSRIGCRDRRDGDRSLASGLAIVLVFLAAAPLGCDERRIDDSAIADAEPSDDDGADQDDPTDDGGDGGDGEDDDLCPDGCPTEGAPLWTAEWSDPEGASLRALEFAPDGTLVIAGAIGWSTQSRPHVRRHALDGALATSKTQDDMLGGAYVAIGGALDDGAMLAVEWDAAPGSFALARWRHADAIAMQHYGLGRLLALATHGEASFACGHTFVQSGPHDDWVAALDASGGVSWVASAAPGVSELDEDDFCTAVAVAPDHDYVMSGGAIERAGETLAWWSVASMLTGEVLAHGEWGLGLENSQVRAIAVSPAQQVHVVGVQAHQTGKIVTVSMGGEVLWEREDPGVSWQFAAVDAVGHLTVMGRTGQAAVVRKMDAQGYVRWQHTIPERLARGLAVAGDRRVAIATEVGAHPQSTITIHVFSP